MSALLAVLVLLVSRGKYLFNLYRTRARLCIIVNLPYRGFRSVRVVFVLIESRSFRAMELQNRLSTVQLARLHDIR